MQQMYYCPNCGAPAAYGQPQCASCNTVFNWQAAQSQQQYQPADYQYPDQQQQWYQASPDYQAQGWGSQGQPQPQKGGDRPGLWQLIKSSSGLILKIAIPVVIVASLISAVIALQGEISKWFAAPAVAIFDVSSPTITEGQEATLQWAVTGASSVSISPAIGTVPSSGTRKISPVKKTTYTLVAGNAFGTASKSVTLDVTGALPAIGSFSVSTNNIYAGQTAKLTWSVTVATTASINPEIGDVPLSGTRDVSPGLTTGYVLTASNSAGNSTASVTLNVTTSKNPVITTFSASPASIKAGEESTLTWDVIGATSINISQGIGGVAVKGSARLTPAATSTYTLMANNAYGSATRDVTVTVDTTNVSNTARTTISTTPPVVNTFSASQNSVTLGDNISLSWAVTGARAISISPDVGSVPSSGWTMVIPTDTTTYILTATNTFGTTTAEAKVTVNRATDGTAPVIRSFNAMPNSINRGGISSLSWDIKGATVITINQGIGIPASKYSQTVSPIETTTYTLTAINSTGTDNATVTVNVAP